MFDIQTVQFLSFAATRMQIYYSFKLLKMHRKAFFI